MSEEYYSFNQLPNYMIAAANPTTLRKARFQKDFLMDQRGRRNREGNVGGKEDPTGTRWSRQGSCSDVVERSNGIEIEGGRRDPHGDLRPVLAEPPSADVVLREEIREKPKLHSLPAASAKTLMPAARVMVVL